MSTELTDAILAMDEDGALSIVKDRLDAGEAPEAVLDDARAAMTTLGDRFACEEVFIPELIMGGEIMKGIAAELKPRITADETAGEARHRRHRHRPRRHPRHRQGRRRDDARGLRLRGPRPRHRRAGRELRRRDQGARRPGRRPLRPAHARLRRDEGHHRGHRRRRPARPGQDHDRRLAGGRAGLHATPAPTAGAATRRPRSRWPPTGPPSRRAEGGDDDDKPRGSRARRTASEAVRRRGRPAQAGPRPADAAGAGVLPHAHGRASRTRTPATTPS